MMTELKKFFVFVNKHSKLWITFDLSQNYHTKDGSTLRRKNHRDLVFSTEKKKKYQYGQPV